MRFKRTIQQFLESSIFRRYMITYVLIFLFPLALIPTTLYSVNNALLTRHICSTQMSMVKQARRALDYEARRYNTIAVMLSNEPYVQNLADVDADMMQPDHVLKMQQIRALMSSSVTVTNDSTSGMCLYLRRSGYIVDSSRALPFAQVYSNLSADSYAEFLNAAQTESSAAWMRVHQDGSDDVYYITPLSTGYAHRGATLMIRLRSAYLNGILRPVSPDEKEWSAVYGSGFEAIYQSGDVPVVLNAEQMCDAEGQFAQDGYLISYVRSDITDDIFINAISRKALFTQLQNLRVITFALLAACFVACGLLSYAFAVYNFNPLRQLAALAQGNNAGNDEYAVLREKLIEAADEKRRLTNRDSLDEHMKRDYDLYRQMLQSENWDDIPLGGGGYYCIARVALIDYSEDCTPAEEMALMRDVFDFEPHPLWRSQAYQQGNDLMLLVRMEEALPSAMQEVTDRLCSAVQLVREHFVADCMVGISSVCRAQGSAADCLRRMDFETHAVLQDPMPGQSICLYRQSDTLELAVKRFLMDASRGGDVEAAIQAFTQEVRVLLRKDGKDKTEEDAEYSLKQQVIDIVQRQYADPSLNVSQIASQLGYSADYVSRTFKRTALIGMLDYIHHTRVKAARGMLAEHPNMNLSEIGAAVGYVSVDSFIRAYKRILGTTPGKDRENQTKQP